MHKILKLVFLTNWCFYCCVLLLRNRYITGYIETSTKLFIDNLLVKFIEFIHEFTLIILNLIGARHDFLNFLLVSHHICQVIEQILHLVHIQLLHFLLLHCCCFLQCCILSYIQLLIKTDVMNIWNSKKIAFWRYSPQNKYGFMHKSVYSCNCNDC